MLQVAEEVGQGNLLLYHGAEVFDLHTLLRHVVAVAYGHAAIVQGIVIHGHAERRTNGVLAAITFADTTCDIVFGAEEVIQLLVGIPLTDSFS